MGISGSQQAPTQARAGIARAGAMRFGYYTPTTVLTINGTVRTSLVNFPTIAITLEYGDAPNTAAFSLNVRAGFTPVAGHTVSIAEGAAGRLIFAGQITRVVHKRRHGNMTPELDVECIDWRRLFDRRLVWGTFTGPAGDIARTIIADNTSGFTAGHVGGGLDTVTVTFSGETPSRCLSRLSALIQGGFYIDTAKDVHLFGVDGESTVAQPTTIANTLPTLKAIVHHYDGTQIRTRAIVLGMASEAAAPVASGETSIPVRDAGIFDAGGGRVLAGSQRLTYTGAIAGGAGTVVGLGAAPAAGPSTSVAAGTGLGTGTYQYAVTFVTGAGESLPSPVASIAVGGIVEAPSYAPSPQLRTAGDGDQAAGYYQYAYTFVTAAGETTSSPETTYINAGNESVRVYQVGLGPNGVTARKVYRSEVDASALKLLTTIPDNGTQFVDDVWDDTVLGAAIPTANTTIGNQVALYGIPIGGASVTARKVYRSVVGGTALKLVATIADNTTTTYTDSTADGSLGASVPGSDTSGLSAAVGQVLSGATSILVAGTSPFSTAGGWALLGRGGAVRYTGISGSSLTGIPSSGDGSIMATVAYGTSITAAPQLVGIPATGVGSLQSALVDGDRVTLLVQVEDIAAQGVLAALEGGDGVYEYSLSDSTADATSAQVIGEADLAAFADALVTAEWDTEDCNAIPGRTQVVNLTVVDALSVTLTITRVTIAIPEPHRRPLRHCEASTVKVSRLLDVVTTNH